MLTVMGIMLTGLLLGFLLRGHRCGWMSKVINVLIWALLFLLGVEVGRDDRIIEGLLSLGVQAVVISVLCTLGSCVAAWALWKWSRS